MHPGHARKLLGKMVDLGLPALGYENIEGGHGGAADNKQRSAPREIPTRDLTLSLHASSNEGRSCRGSAAC